MNMRKLILILSLIILNTSAAKATEYKNTASFENKDLIY
jgi:hypothetical protein